MLNEKKKTKKNKGLWHNIWKRRRAGKRPKRPGEKGYPKTLDVQKESLSFLRQFIRECVAAD